ncbi:unnamed protein product [Rhizophagus irregularis]|nr:unnamed protein product [Rhizophagus irregularis]CAB5350642.1 unnamed protein product [Rhizophagus irregularis]
MNPYRPGHYAQYRAPYERPPFTPPGGPPTYGQTSWGGYTSGTLTQRSAYMASRPDYGIPLGGISPVEKLTTLFIGGISPGVIDDWMEKILKTCGTLNSWKHQSGNPEIQRGSCWRKVKADENTRKYLDQYEGLTN